MNMSILVTILRFAIGLIPVAERVFSDKPKSGAEKKEMIVETTKAVAETIEKESTGGQKETWSIINNALDPLIDLAVGVLNAFGILKK